MIRPWYRSRVFWFAMLGLAFLGTSWVMSMQATRGVSWRSGDRALFLATSDGSVRVGYEGRATREAGFQQWSIPRGDYENRTTDTGWFATPRIERDPSSESWILALPHWGLIAGCVGLLALVGAGAGGFAAKAKAEVNPRFLPGGLSAAGHATRGKQAKR